MDSEYEAPEFFLVQFDAGESVITTSTNDTTGEHTGDGPPE